MLKKIKTVNVTSNGREREVLMSDMFVNVEKIVSIVDYDNIKKILFDFSPDLKQSDFSLLKISEGPNLKELIVLGTAEEVYQSLSCTDSPGLLNE